MDDASDTLRAASDHLDGLLRSLESHGDLQVRRQVAEAVELLMSLQGAAFERVLTLAADPAAGGSALVNQIADDPLVGQLLLVHGIHPHGTQVRLSRRLERIRGRIAALGCRASCEGIEGSSVRVRVAGVGRLSSERSIALHQLLETTLLDAAPELTSVVVLPEGDDTPALLQIIRSPDAGAASSVPNV